MSALTEKALSGDIRAIARLISEVENETPRSDAIMSEMFKNSGRAHLIGITGSPGAGKSTLVNQLIKVYRSQGKTVGIIAVDPSSPFSGGAILADRIRMQEHSGDEGVYIRSMGSRGSLGGLSKSTYGGAQILDACGFDVVIIETVGVGQSEIDIIKIADSVCLILVPGMGDDMQIMKAGIMEIADLFVINKADHDGVDRLNAEIQLMLRMFGTDSGWQQPLVQTVAQTGRGVPELVEALDAHLRYLRETPDGQKRKEFRLRFEVEQIVARKLASTIEKEWRDMLSSTEVMDELQRRETDPYSVASGLIRRLKDL